MDSRATDGTIHYAAVRHRRQSAIHIQPPFIYGSPALRFCDYAGGTNRRRRVAGTGGADSLLDMLTRRGDGIIIAAIAGAALSRPVIRHRSDVIRLRRRPGFAN